MADTTTYNRMKDVVDALIDQLRNRIDGSTGYNNRLKHNQIVLGARAINEQSVYPFVCVPTVSWDVEQVTVDANYMVEFEIEIHGYVKSEDDALKRAMELGSDIERAIRADSSLGEGVIAFQLRPCEAVSQDEFGGCLLTFTGKYPITLT